MRQRRGDAEEFTPVSQLERRESSQKHGVFQETTELLRITRLDYVRRVSSWYRQTDGTPQCFSKSWPRSAATMRIGISQRVLSSAPRGAASTRSALPGGNRPSEASQNPVLALRERLLLARRPARYQTRTRTQFPTAEIDHLAVTPFGVFIFETKHWSGHIAPSTANGYHTHRRGRTGRRPTFPEPSTPQGPLSPCRVATELAGDRSRPIRIRGRGP
ncbi:nuclease-related domain-containing protein [Caballeronia sp. EK]|uniref:nuclease-related domain-containing protein n=1 Tax=Caballeronia sp. EK TaxID=2767469 RepID=UPI002815E96D|nr:nuclease-related domain-containing protein [Caballeronia sp. EK]